MFGSGSTNHIAGPGTYILASWLFLRVLGFIYLVAFFSLAIQVKGLIGKRGIMPAAEFLHGRKHWGPSRFWRTPTLCWLNTSDAFILFLSWTGVALSLALVVGFAPVPCLILSWICYLSLFEASNIFLGYQWDILLLETGFPAMFMAPLEILPSFPPPAEPPRIVIGLMWWLLFRLMFSSGIAKLRSGDPSWRNLTALCHHYETQPLPTPVAWYVHQLPRPFHKFSTVFMFLVEVLVPFLILGPPPVRYVASALFILLMLLIQLTGNYCFFNFLGIALSLLLLDDKALLPAFGSVFPGIALPSNLAPLPAGLEVAVVAVAVVIIALSLRTVLRLFRFEIDWPGPLEPIVEFLDAFRLVNSYGLFSVMTIERPEIVVEGSSDGIEWREYQFKWKPGDITRAPRFVAPHQPRLDWQLWFAALGYYKNHPWFPRFLKRLLEGSPEVLSLLRTNPFPGTNPRFVRGVLYDYQFTTRAERRLNGAWWKREWRGLYSPVLQIADKD